jgi:hypothetical protein
MIIVCHQRISLVTPAPIAQDQVETLTCTIFPVVLKASEVVNNSTCKHFIDHCLSWPFKLYGAIFVDAHNLCSPDSRFAICNSDPQCYPLIKALVHLFQLVHLPGVAETLGNVDKCLRLANSLAKVELVDGCFQSGLNPFFNCPVLSFYIRQHLLQVAYLDTQLSVRLCWCSCGVSQNVK